MHYSRPSPLSPPQHNEHDREPHVMEVNIASRLSIKQIKVEEKKNKTIPHQEWL